MAETIIVEQAQTKKRPRTSKTTYVPRKVYPPDSGIPYAVSRPNAFWRIKKNLPADQYWKKRYWRRRITGRGDYTMNYSKRSIGANWGGYLGSKAGEFIGGAAQRAFGAITGFGEYKVNSNVFANGSLPQVVNNPGEGGTIVRFQEYLGDVVTSGTAGAFKILSYNLNAADNICFPWLSQLAANYEQYEFQGLLFQFRSTSADALNSTNTALGSVMMATQYDFLDNTFTSKGEMLNYEFSTSCKPSENCMHMIECAPKQTSVSQLYTLSGLLPSGADPRLYNLGKFSIATTGFQGTNVNIGELHVTYQVKLLKPKLEVTLGGVIDEYLSVQKTTTGPVWTGTSPLGINPAVNETSNSGNTMGVQLTGGTTLTFLPTNQRLYYYVQIYWFGTGTGATTLNNPSITNGSYDASPVVSPEAGVVCQNASMGFSFLTAGNGLATVVTFPAQTIAAQPTGGEIRIRILQKNPEIPY